MAQMPELIDLSPGDPVPRFQARTRANPRYSFESVAGRYVVLCFFGSAGQAGARIIIDALIGLRGSFFNDETACLFGVSIDPEDEAQQRIGDLIPGVRFFWDFDHRLSMMFGRLSATERGVSLQPATFVLDPMLRVLARFVTSDPARHAAEITAYLRALPLADALAGTEISAPVLMVPRVFEPEMCAYLRGLYEAEGGEDSGFMRQQGELTVGVRDYSVKRRSDLVIRDATLKTALRNRIARRLIGEIRRFFVFEVTRIERYIVSCYDAEVGGFFRPHRDNTTTATAHRRFAVTLNLNAEDFEGGELRFPEFGSRTYRAPTGGAVVFSCSMLHEATPVTRGRRLAFLPFLYDESGVRQRTDGQRFLVGDGDQPEGVTPPPGEPPPSAP